ncbi:hypothetical protein PENTCL1PPCAC_15644 [Pristionchus entomophagus]|uniref:Enoyl-[acyl-carrier-protein] reductase, mitochondrial n=1 Tax=Pristionchus entomophagus TaxID=358040 RepID=A0AAV5TDR2_9BILA|nr:hypothetical protein PENTCL1PPCAC_15644 [Pristionchus entomophagus]
MQRRAIKYSQFGDPREVTELITETISTDLEPNRILIRWLASPINPLDINKIQGVYIFQPELPVIAGTEGVGRVVKVGSSVIRVAPGDKAAIYAIQSSCWADYSVVDESDIVKIDQRITPIQGATMMVNPPTAWLMFKKGELERGDWIIQNSANSGVGRAVIEMAKEKGYHTINIVRDRSNIKELKDELTRLGGDIVWTEEEVKTEGRAFKGRPKLALNGVGGKSCLQISSLLGRGGMLITYGGMSKKAHEISTSALVFNNITAVGLSNPPMMMIDGENADEYQRMLSEIQDMYIRGVLHPPPMDEHPLDNYKIAITNSMDGKHAKQIFVMEEEKQSKL